MYTKKTVVVAIAAVFLLATYQRYALYPADATPYPSAFAAKAVAASVGAQSRVIAPRAGRMSPTSDPPPEFAPDRILVKFAPNTSEPVIERVIAGIGGTKVQSYRSPGLLLIRLPDNVSVSEAETYFQKTPEIERVEKDLVYYLFEIPDDPSFAELWGLNNLGQDDGVTDVDLNAPEAWNEIVGSQDFVIGVIDSGVELDHPDLQGNLWVNPGEIPDNGIDDDSNGHVDDVHGIDQIEFDGSPDDDLGHGTHVAGTIAAVGNNGIGVTGVMWEADILPCKVFSVFGWTTLSRILTCIDYFIWAKDSGIEVIAINNSWGGGGFSWSLSDAIAELDSRDILFVASAGNSGADLDLIPSYPVSYKFDNVFGVAAIDRTGALASFSNFGVTQVDIAAPGVDILSTVRFGGWDYLSGTSMSAPHLTGAIGIIKASAPSMSGQQIKAYLMATGVADPLLQSSIVSGRRLRLDLPFIDLDTDQISDRWERRYGLDPGNPTDAGMDPDTDGLDNLAEFVAKTNPLVADTDGDTLNDGDELNQYFTNPLLADSDGDGLADSDELLSVGTDPNVPDTDQDGLSDSDEHNVTGTDPLNEDTDSDGLRDGFELAYQFDPFTAGEQNLDIDNDGLTALQEQAAGTDPRIADSDGDSVSDGDEVNVHGTDPLNVDTDRDDMRDDWEIANGLVPTDAIDQRLDPDADGFTNLEESFADSDPLDSLVIPGELGWSSQQGNAKHNGFVAIHTDASDFDMRWTTVLPDSHGDAVPAADRRALYAVMGNTFGAADMAQGQIEWRTPQAVSSNRGFPTIDKLGVYLIAYSANLLERWLLGYNRITGEPLYPAVSLQASQGATDVTADSGDLFIQNALDLLKLDAATGAEIWRTPYESSATYEAAPIAVDDHYVVTGANDRLQVFDRADGTLLHDTLLPTCVLGAEQIALDGVGYAYVLCPLQLSRVRLADGQVEWFLIYATTISAFAVDARHVYVSTWETLRVLDRVTGEEAWNWETGARTDGNIVVTLDHVFVGTFGGPYQKVAIDLDTHEVVWHLDQHGNFGLTGDGALVVQPEWAEGVAVIDLHGDRDADGLKDWWERFHGLNLADPADAGTDLDGDGLDNGTEYSIGTNPNLPDTDADGLNDGEEIGATASDPLVADTDYDGLSDFDEVNVFGTQPANADSDGDGYQDGDEVNTYGTSPTDPGSVPSLLETYAESFESEIPTGWTNGVDADHEFERSSDDASDGVYSLKSPPVPIFETVAIEWQAEFAGGGLQFDYRITGQALSDRLRVFVNGMEQLSLDSNSWATAQVAIGRGPATVRFEYDASTSLGFPTVHVDNIRFGPLPAFGLNVDNVLLVANNMLHEYRKDGSRTRPPLAIPNAIDARDPIVLVDHRIAIPDAPFVHIYDPALRRFSTAEVEGWSFGGNLRNSAIAAIGDEILLAAFPFNAIHRLDRHAALQETVLTATTYVSFHRGQDGLLYAQPSFDGRYERLDSDTLQPTASYWLPTLDSSGIAVTESGDVYTVGVNQQIQKYNSANELLEYAHLETKARPVGLELSESGLLFAGSADGELMIIGKDLRQQHFVSIDSAPSSNMIVFVASIPSAGPDGDGEQVPDWWERVHGLDIADAADGPLDPDADGLTNAEEFQSNGDPWDADTDDDGLADALEVNSYGSLVTVSDTDNDGLSDFEEVMQFGTNPIEADSDGDGLSDGAEVSRHLSDPLDNDSDNDGLADGEEFRNYLSLNDASDSTADFDRDGLTNLEELAIGTDLRIWDSDSDGLGDGDETLSWGTDPRLVDTDADHLDDGWEIRYGLDPQASGDVDADTDGDGFVNRVEYYSHSDPDSPVSVPVPPPWETDQGTVRHTAYVPVRLDPGLFKVDWSVAPVSGTNDALRQVAVGRDRVFVSQPDTYYSGQRHLTALERSDGATAWQHFFSNSNNLSQPALDEDSVYVQTRLSTSGSFVWGIRQTDGNVRFQTEHQSRFTDSRAPAVHDGGVYIAMGGVGGIGRFDAGTGVQTWNVETDYYDDQMSPAIDGQHVYNYSPAKSMVNVIDAATGFHGYSIFNPLAYSFGGGFTSLTLGSRQNLIVNEGEQVSSFDLPNRGIAWAAPGSSYLPHALGNGVIYFAESNSVHAMDERDGSTLWRWPVMRNIYSNVVATVDHVFVSTDVETFAIEIATVGAVWSYPAGGYLSMSDDQVLYIAGSDGLLTSVSTQDDLDKDFLPDNWEQRFGFDISDPADAATDADGDGLSERDEYLARTDPRSPDTDNDSLSDFDELRTLRTRALSADSDGDGLSDIEELQQWDTNPNAGDSDGDGISDTREVHVLGTSPTSADSDGDGYSDPMELARSSSASQASSHPTPVAEFLESFESAAISPRFANGSSGFGQWEVKQEGAAADGEYYLRPAFIDSEMSAEFSWDDNFAGGVLTYHVAIDERNCCNSLTIYLDGQLVETISQNQTWKQHFVVVPAGHHVIRWRFVRSRISSDEQMRTFVDMIRYSNADRDGDGIPTDWEIIYGMDPDDPGDATQDSDGDSLTNIEEYQLGTSPVSADSDSDRMPDGWEVVNQLNPLANDAAGDADGDGLSNWQEFDAGTAAQVVDTDGDQMPDGWEVNNRLDPLVNDAAADPDGDGASNLQEYRRGTDPLFNDSPPPPPPPPPAAGSGGGGGGATDPLGLAFLSACVLFMFCKQKIRNTRCHGLDSPRSHRSNTPLFRPARCEFCCRSPHRRRPVRHSQTSICRSLHRRRPAGVSILIWPGSSVGRAAD